MMFRWTTPAAKGNRAIQDGSLMTVIENLLEQLQPEAADPAQIPQIAEPLLQQLEAEIEFLPVMNIDDLRRALSCS